MKFIVDTREQNPLKFRNIETIRKKLDAGDYSIEGMEHLISIERKSAADLYGTLGKGNKRFQKELKRAVNHDIFVLLIESPYHVVKEKAFENAHYCGMRPDVLMKILWTLMIKYRIYVMFCNGRVEALQIVKGILTSYYNHKKKPTKFKNSISVDLDMVQKVEKMKRKWKMQ